ncbi:MULTISPECIES: DoxX family protein [Ancylobacter]|uniref:Transmembrane protein n=2 Tax=Ancylobacter TaxID=99 RepID=A0A839Z403_9HYPH|nr:MULTISPECIES: DoxX family protein [Ancylobacter]MBB3771414.1 transmembrane protein [Ancylobacter tetraedralis]MDQ0509278.1 transmembrane protein [Ancylobacter amanitiformis]
MTPAIISAILRAPATAFVARLLLVFMFLGSAISKLVDFPGAQTEMAFFGLNPPWLFAALTIFTQIVGGLLILLNRATWLGAGALAIFTLLTIPIAHHFWNMEGPMAQLEFYVAVEHFSVVGGMLLVAILAERTRAA